MAATTISTRTMRFSVDIGGMAGIWDAHPASARAGRRGSYPKARVGSQVAIPGNRHRIATPSSSASQ
jgi:hypothetical protein